MRSALGRSATPEISALQHEGRASSRSLRYEAREESVPEPTSLIVKLRINPRKWREYLQNPGAYAKPAPAPAVAPTPPSVRTTPGANSMPPPPSPAMAPRSNPTGGAAPVEASPKPSPTPKSGAPPPKTWQYYPDGRADAPFPQVASTEAVSRT
jgi:SWI/SNF-related matrix-associated actin-dependent regulator of chromatin subfamily B protein 1